MQRKPGDLLVYAVPAAILIIVLAVSYFAS
jgi:hypothetical protein